MNPRDHGGTLRTLLGRLRRRVGSGLVAGWADRWPIARGSVPLPYDRTCPVIFDKDDVLNCYTDEYLMALASAGTIELAGLVTSTSVAPYNRWVSAADYEGFASQRAALVERARRSGFARIPDPVRGPCGHLRRPPSGRIEDTRPFESAGTRTVLDVAARASADHPLVLVLCGPLTLAADAYLIDPGIADRVVAAWFGGGIGGMGDYNGWADAWAAYIVLERMPLVQFVARNRAGPFPFSPEVPKERLRELPPSELRDWMTEKQHPNGQPGDVDADAPPAISLVRPDYAARARRVSFHDWTSCTMGDTHRVPAFRDDRAGRALVITHARRDVATSEWWRALSNPQAYLQKAQ